MKYLNLILLQLITVIFSISANAGVSCTFYIAGDTHQPNNKNKVLFEAPVIRSPSNDPNDPKRFTYIRIKSDLSVASLISSDQVEDLKSKGAQSEAGNYLVSLQETVTPGVDAIIIRKFDASFDWSEPQNWIGEAYGAAPVFGLNIPSTHFSILCESK